MYRRPYLLRPAWDNWCASPFPVRHDSVFLENWKSVGPFAWSKACPYSAQPGLDLGTTAQVTICCKFKIMSISIFEFMVTESEVRKIIYVYVLLPPALVRQAMISFSTMSRAWSFSTGPGPGPLILLIPDPWPWPRVLVSCQTERSESGSLPRFAFACFFFWLEKVCMYIYLHWHEEFLNHTRLKLKICLIASKYAKCKSVSWAAYDSEFLLSSPDSNPRKEAGSWWAFSFGIYFHYQLLLLHTQLKMDPFFENEAKLTRVLFQNVTNVSDVRKLVLTASLPFCLLKPRLVSSLLWFLIFNFNLI